MYLKTLELHGFKSFPEKTVLHFNAGTTVIVGPNGSGKSNITDAMRWVLGELSTKNIRGSKMEDVIFVGADGHRPMGFAEVSVTFDDSEEPRKLNSPYTEITVTRRYYRAGDSEYFINRSPVRLKDIHELFMNTGIGREGYSIIGQGKIAEIISKKSDERRGIFEESAGISKYRYKKQEAQKKLAETSDNMTSIELIYSEIESRIGPLERDAKKARRYMELYDEKKSHDVALWLYDMARLREDMAKTEAECRLSAHELEMIQDEEARLEAQSDRIFSVSQENKRQSERTYEQIRNDTETLHELENRCHRMESEAERGKSLIEAEEAGIARISEQISREEDRLKEANSAAAAADETAKNVGGELCALEREKAAAEKIRQTTEKFLADKFEDQKAAEEKLAELRLRLNVLKNTMSEQSNRGASIAEDIRKYQSEISELDASIADISETVDDYTAAADKSAALIDELSLAELHGRDAEERARREHAAAAADLSAMESRIAAMQRMQEHFDGYNNSVRYVMRAASEGKLRGVRGPVSRLISVDEKYITAVETALGASLQNIVVDDESAAKAAIRELKNAGAGRATFYPLTSIRPSTMTAELKNAAGYRGFIGYGDELVKADDQYKNVVSNLLGRTVVFDNLDNATDMAKASGWRVRVVTLDGQQINAGGSFTGGSAKRDSGMLSRESQISKLTARRDEMRKAEQQLADKLAGVAAAVQRSIALRRSEEEKLKIAESMLRTERSHLDEQNARRGVVVKLLADLTADAENLDDLGRRGGEDAARMESECASAESVIASIADERAEADIKLHEAEDELIRIAAADSDGRIRYAEAAKDAEAAAGVGDDCRARIAELEADIAAARERIAAVNGEIEQSRRLAAEGREEAKRRRDELDKAESLRASLEEGGMEYERRLNELRKKLKEVADRKEILYKAHTKNEAKFASQSENIDKNTARLWDEYELTHTAAAELELPAVTEDNRRAMALRLGELKTEIKSLGNVNLGAIDEYAEQKERYDYLGGQLEDLRVSRDDLEKIISSIEDEMRRMFIEAFDKINRNFGEVFRELFGGGSASLTLTNPEDVLSSGVEINAAPPGKMVKNLSLLSGGEQAFVAIALLFALIRVNPSPFCIFDEIEAALDEVNVSRVANYVKRFSKELQIITITHRRGMMETADTLYGVTMPRRGISKVFTLDVNEVAQRNAAGEDFAV